MAEVIQMPQPWPELVDITVDKDIVPAFPTELLPEPFSTFVEDVADRMQVPADCVAIPLIIVAATMIGRAFRLAPKRHDDWSERPCLWGGIIAPSGTRKTPAAEEALRPIKAMQRELWDGYKQSHAAWMDQEEVERGPEPLLETMITNEATVEAIVGLMSDDKNANARGIMFYRDELSGWVQAMNKYRNGGGDDRQFFLECHSGGSFRVDRKGTGPVYVSDLYLSIFGTIQPDVVKKVFREGDLDGMTARYQLIVWPRVLESVAVVDRRPNFEVRKKVEDRLRSIRNTQASDDSEEWLRLDESSPIAGAGHTLRFAGEAYALFNRWLLRNENRPERKNGGPFGIHISKYPGLFARLALTLHFMKHGERAPRVIGRDIAEATEKFIDEYLEPHAHRIYGHLASHPARPGAVRIARWLGEERVPKFRVRDVRRKGWAEFAKTRDEEMITAAVNLLEAQGWVRVEQIPSTARGGRPSTQFVTNPVILKR